MEFLYPPIQLADGWIVIIFDMNDHHSVKVLVAS